jgi:hypothetical protein
LPRVPLEYDPALRGTLGFGYGRNEGDRVYPITRLDDGSPLKAAGAVVGDRIRLDHASDVWRVLALGEPVGLELIRGESRTHLELRTVADPKIAAHEATNRFLTWLFKGVQLVALAMGALIAWRQSASGPMRALGASMLALGIFSLYNYWPRGSSTTGSRRSSTAPTPCCSTPASSIPRSPSRASVPPWRLRWVRLVFAAWFIASALYWVAFPLRVLGMLPPPLQRALSVWPVGDTLIAFGVLITVPALVSSWRHATGTNRQRFAWMGVCGGSLAVVNSLPLAAGVWLQDAGYAVAWDLFSSSVTALAIFGMGWAMLRHRLIDVGFALNRLSVYLLLAAMLLGALLAAQAGLATAGLGGDSRGALFLNGVVGAGLLLALFVPARGVAERIVQRLLYPHWRAVEERLNRAVAAAATVCGRDALLAHYLAALADYTGGAAASYYDCSDDRCVRIAGGDAAAPASLSLDAADRERVLAGRLPRSWRGWSGDYALAAPVSHRGRLTAMLVMGGRPDGNQYRPDEARHIAAACTRSTRTCRSRRSAPTGRCSKARPPPRPRRAPPPSRRTRRRAPSSPP